MDANFPPPPSLAIAARFAALPAATWRCLRSSLLCLQLNQNKSELHQQHQLSTYQLVLYRASLATEL
jgi:hypothetical protein